MPTKNQALEELRECASEGDRLFEGQPNDEECRAWSTRTLEILSHVLPDANHARVHSFAYAVGRGQEGRLSFQPAFPGAHVGRMTRIVANTRAQLESLQETIRWLEKGLMDEEFDELHSARPAPGAGRGVHVNVTTPMTVNAPATATASSSSTSSSNSAVSVHWEQALAACRELEGTNGDDAADILKEIRDAVTKGGAKPGLRERVRSLFGYGVDFTMKILPWLLEHGDKLLPLLLRRV